MVTVQALSEHDMITTTVWEQQLGVTNFDVIKIHDTQKELVTFRAMWLIKTFTAGRWNHCQTHEQHLDSAMVIFWCA